jgi:hypothetical protein
LFIVRFSIGEIGSVHGSEQTLFGKRYLGTRNVIIGVEIPWTIPERRIIVKIPLTRNVGVTVPRTTPERRIIVKIPVPVPVSRVAVTVTNDRIHCCGIV